MKELKLGKIKGIEIWVKLKDDDPKVKIELTDLSSNSMKIIDDLIKERKNNPMNKWLSDSKHFIKRDAYLRVVNLKMSILKNRSVDDETYLLYLIQTLNMKGMKELCKDHEIKGYSGLKRGELVEFIGDNLSKEEAFEYIEENELDLISQEFAKALRIFNEKEKEKLVSVKVINEKEHEMELKFAGFNWELESSLSINENNIKDCFRDCDCLIGRDKGFCSHFWVGFILSVKKDYFNPIDWRLTALPIDFEKLIKSLRVKP